MKPIVFGNIPGGDGRPLVDDAVHAKEGMTKNAPLYIHVYNICNMNIYDALYGFSVQSCHIMTYTLRGEYLHF